MCNTVSPPSPMSIVHSFKDVLQAKHVCWPSKTIRFPYVSDVCVKGARSNGTTMAHSPSLDAAGLLQPGSRLLVTRNSEKCKTPYAMQLLEDEGELLLVNPLCANKIVHNILDQGLIRGLSAYKVARAEVTVGDSRFDFKLQHRKDASKEMLLEVKHVSSTDIAKDAPEPPRKPHFIVRAKRSRADGTYKRAALFPVDRAQQKVGKRAVVSERAIKHVTGLRTLQEKGTSCCVLFLVCRGDAESFRPCHERCPVFAEELLKARRAGVRVLAAQIAWDWRGRAAFKKELPVVMRPFAAQNASAKLSKAVVAKGSSNSRLSVCKRPASKITAKPIGRASVVKRKAAGSVRSKYKRSRLA